TIGGNFGQQGFNTDVQTTKQPSPFQQLVGGAASAAGGAAKLGWQPFCWVAREVYGDDDPRWMKFRQWMLKKSPMWLFGLYITHGDNFARFIRNKPYLKAPIRG